MEHSSPPFKALKYKTNIMKLWPFDSKAQSHENRQVERIAKNSLFWSGVHTQLVNFREVYSMTFTTDFFGNTESRAVVKTLYDRICRSALCRLKEIGFDISDYQDESGRFSINADSIEQLVVGEQVYMERKRKADLAAGGRKSDEGREQRGAEAAA
jgi:hypothetical protein